MITRKMTGHDLPPTLISVHRLVIESPHLGGTILFSGNTIPYGTSVLVRLYQRQFTGSAVLSPPGWIDSFDSMHHRVRGLVALAVRTDRKVRASPSDDVSVIHLHRPSHCLSLDHSCVPFNDTRVPEQKVRRVVRGGDLPRNPAHVRVEGRHRQLQRVLASDLEHEVDVLHSAVEEDVVVENEDVLASVKQLQALFVDCLVEVLDLRALVLNGPPAALAVCVELVLIFAVIHEEDIVVLVGANPVLQQLVVISGRGEYQVLAFHHYSIFLFPQLVVSLLSSCSIGCIPHEK
mmetsp:Transcript_32036/g.61920  ORF Transcript_32036/g.61920 Transcript_32036/m.61920 type:complete len:291 (+) Transcript_32036:259-1131(+)